MNNKKSFSKTGVKGTNELTDIDSMLKDHLKASIGMERIEVSEDLVQRTLQKIKQSEENIESDDNNRIVEFRRRRNRNFKGLVSVAAAVVLVVASVTVWQRGMIGNDHKKLDQNTEMGILEMAPVTESAQGDASLNYGIASDANESKIEMTTRSTEEGNEESADSALIAPENEKMDIALTGAAMFSMNYYIESYQDVTSFIVTKAEEKPVDVTDKAVKVEALYGLLDQYTMNSLTDNLGEDWTYKADIKLIDKREITIYIWETGEVAVSNLVSTEEKSYYSVENTEEFLKRLSDLYSSLK